MKPWVERLKVSEILTSNLMCVYVCDVMSYVMTILLNANAKCQRMSNKSFSGIVYIFP